MAIISKDKAIKILHQKGVRLFTMADAKKIFGHPKDNTLYKIIQRLKNAEVVQRVGKGKFLFLLRKVDNFELANFLVNPSYVSLESALSFYGILPQFPYSITSITPLRTRKITSQEREYEFAHLEKKYFFGFEQKNGFLIATKEKALLDLLYFMAKKLRHSHLSDLDLSHINKKQFRALASQYHFIPLQNLIKQTKII